MNYDTIISGCTGISDLDILYKWGEVYTGNTSLECA